MQAHAGAGFDPPGPWRRGGRDRPGRRQHPLWRVGGRHPLHSAPWRDEAEVQEDESLPLVNRRLAGDFLCMPFGRDDVEEGPIHGLPANTPWDVVEQDVAHATFRLQARPRGATVTKRVQLVGPALLQTHTIEGGAGDVTLAHHPMVQDGRGRAAVLFAQTRRDDRSGPAIRRP
jgi:hypothetical protein